MQTLISSTNEQMSNAGKTLLNALKMATAEASTTRKKRQIVREHFDKIMCAPLLAHEIFLGRSAPSLG
jgi:hypothetical protein